MFSEKFSHKIAFYLNRKKFQSVKKIDIGCGNWKEEGYFGLDCFNGKQVDYVIDFNKESLPFRDNSIEHIVSYHALEHIHNLQFLLEEIYRVLKPNGEFFCCVPYGANHINVANIFHVWHFNEHSFRFFSSETRTDALDEKLWKFYFVPDWGLKNSANSCIKAEFRTNKIDIDYYPEYINYTEKEKEEARLSKMNVAHNICFYLQAIKNDPVKLKNEDLIIPNKRKWMIEHGWK